MLLKAFQWIYFFLRDETANPCEEANAPRTFKCHASRCFLRSEGRCGGAGHTSWERQQEQGPQKGGGEWEHLGQHPPPRPRRRVRTRSGCPTNHLQIFGRGIIQFSGVTGAKKLGSMGEIENKTDFRAVKGRTFQQWSLTKDGMGWLEKYHYFS